LSNSLISIKIINWYDKNGRDLPWRHTRDPYKIWLSEIILQQTRVNQGLPYYYEFVENYPKVENLAAATEQEVLRSWQGLGYYSRARNLHACAKILVKKYNGEFPKTFKNILKLPGIGRYTAAAIASFAFKEPVPAIDGNVFRVLSRLYGIDKDILAARSRKEFEEVANDLIPLQEPDKFNQAMMEFGAMQCTPKSPDCTQCPVAVECYARETGRQADFPVKIKKVKVRKRFFHYFVFRYKEKIWLSQRSKGDIWQGLFDFWLSAENRDREIADSDINSLLTDLKIQDTVGEIDVSSEYKHVLTHQVILAQFILVDLTDKSSLEKLIKSNGGQFYSVEEIKDLPKPVLVSRYLNDAIF